MGLSQGPPDELPDEGAANGTRKTPPSGALGNGGEMLVAMAKQGR
jgi:hypothetical protein